MPPIRVDLLSRSLKAIGHKKSTFFMSTICLEVGYLRVLVTSSTFLETRSNSSFLAWMADSKLRSSAVLVDTSLNSGWRADLVLVKIILLILSLMLRMFTHCDIFSSASCMEATFCSRPILSDSSSTIAAFKRNAFSLTTKIFFKCQNMLGSSALEKSALEIIPGFVLLLSQFPPNNKLPCLLPTISPDNNP